MRKAIVPVPPARPVVSVSRNKASEKLNPPMAALPASRAAAVMSGSETSRRLRYPWRLAPGKKTLFKKKRP